MCLVASYHLYDEVFARQAVSESGVVVVFIEDGDEGRARGAAARGASVLDQHHQLVARLLLSVQNSPCTDLTWRQKEGDEWDFVLRHSSLE